MLRFVRLFSLGLALLVLSGCAALNPGPRTYTISQAQLLELIAKRFPVNDRVAELLDLQALAPRIKLLPDSNRIATELDLNLSERLMRNAFRDRWRWTTVYDLSRLTTPFG